MSNSRKLIVPALFAVGVFALAPVVSGLGGANAGANHSKGFKAAGVAPGGTGGTDKNGGDTGGGGNGGGGKGGGGNGGGNGGGGKGGGGNGGGKGGGGNGGDNGGGNGGGGKGGGGNGGGNGGGGKGGGGNGGGGEGHRHGHGNPNNNGEMTGGFSFGSSGASDDYVGHQQITCIVNGQLIAVRSSNECRYGRGFVHNGDSYFGGEGFAPQPDFSSHRRTGHYNNYDVRNSGHHFAYDYGRGYGDGGNNGGGDVYVGSNAAVMQAKRRTHEHGYGFNGQAAFGNNGGYDYGVGYGPQGGDGYGSAEAYDQGYGRRGHRSHFIRHLRHRSYQSGNMGGYGFGADAGGCNCNNPGYVVHYGPAISKDGGY